MMRAASTSSSLAPRSALITGAALLVLACAPAAEQEDATPGLPTGDNSQTSLDWAGAYVGVVPCADCAGIDTRITLTSDGRYQLRRRYQGKGDSAFTMAGEFSWDSAGRTITLGGTIDGADRYQVMEEALLQLDPQGERITGDLAAAYRLSKLTVPTEGAVAQLVTGRWRLIAVRGRPLAPRPAGATVPYLDFDFIEERVSGTGGCNRLSGGFELSAGDRIRFSPQMASTMMACEDMSGDQALAELLPTVDNYAILGDTLTLNRARMAPLLTFLAGPRP